MYRAYMMAIAIACCLLVESPAIAEEPLNPDVVLVDDAVSLFMRDFNVPGVSVALYYNGYPFLYSYGYADAERKAQITPDTLFEIGSITKVFTGIAFAWETLSGRMAPHDLLIRYIPGLETLQLKEIDQEAKKGKDSKVKARKDREKEKEDKEILPITEVTLLHLATHSSSLPRMPPQKPKLPAAYTPERMAAWLKSWTPKTPVGTRYNYSNVGFGLLGYAIAMRNGVSYEQVITAEILGPLGMKSTFVKVPEELEGRLAKGYQKDGDLADPAPQTAWPASGALRSTGRDMQQFMMASLGLKGTPPLLHAMAVSQKGLFRVNDSLVMGLGWQRFERNKELTIIDKNGSTQGFSSYIGLVPSKKIGIVILANKGGAETTALGRALLERLSSKKAESSNTQAKKPG